MAKAGDYKISDIYHGGYSGLSPSYGDFFTGYHMPSSHLGASTNPTTANQIQEINNLLNQGIVPIEVGAIQPEIFDQIPKQYFKEMGRMAKLTGAKISVHAPISGFEPSGITREGWSEANRQSVERQLNSVVEKAMTIGTKERIPITIHSATETPGTEYMMTPEGKKVERMIIINQDSGKMIPLYEEKRHIPGLENLEKGETVIPDKKRIEELNKTEWVNTLSQISYAKERFDRVIEENIHQVMPVLEKLDKKEYSPENLDPIQRRAFQHIGNAQNNLISVKQEVSGLFNNAWKYGTPQEKKILSQANENFKKELSEGKKFDIGKQSEALQNLINTMSKVTPQMYMQIEDFARGKSAETFSNVAFNAFEKSKKQNKPAPIISIENLYPGIAFSQGKEMNELIMESKNKFAEKAMKKGYSEKEAKSNADKMIGVTLDVGHLNIGKKKGFSDEDLANEVKEFAKHVKHVHLTDNFGYSDSHLPPGMGNVPIKKIFEELEKQGSLKDATKIVEAGGFVQQFKTSPLQYTLEGMGSPIYSMEMAPYWNQSIGLSQGYFAGYGMILPQGNYEMFGAGFSQLPAELGGQKPGRQGSRMSGRERE